MALGDATLAPPQVTAPVVERAAPAEAATELTLHDRRGRAVLAGFTTAHFTHHTSNSLLNPLLPFIRDGFNLSYAESGFLVSAFSLSLGVSNAPIGFLADRVGARPVIVVGLIATGAMSVALALAGAYWQLIALLVLMGLIAGTYHAPAASLIAQVFPVRVRGMAMGIHLIGGHLSFFAAPFVAALLVSATGTWRTPFLWFAIAPVCAGVLLWYLVPRIRVAPQAGVDRWAVFRELWTVVRLVGPLVSVSLLFQIVYAAILAFLALYLVDARGLPAAFAAAAFGVPQLIGVFAAPFSGWLSDRWGRRAVILLGMCTMGPTLVALLLVPTELILLPMAAIGLTGALRNTATEVHVLDTAPAQRRATILGAYYMLSQELGGVAVPFLGVLAGAVGIASAFGGACVGLGVLSGLVLVAHRKL